MTDGKNRMKMIGRKKKRKEEWKKKKERRELEQ